MRFDDEACDGPGCESGDATIIFDEQYGLAFCSARCHEQWIDEVEYQFHVEPPPVDLDEPDVLPFALVREPAAKPKPVTFHDNRAAQAMLFSGLDCLAGQTDLFSEGELR